MVAPRRTILNVPLDEALSEPVAHSTAKFKLPKTPKALKAPKPQKPTKPARPARLGKSRKPWFLMTFLVLLLCLAIIVAAVSLLFSKGTILIKAKSIPISVNSSLIAKANATAPDLGYQVLTVTEEAHAQVNAKPGPAIEKKATGTVVLYNMFSAAPQKLPAGTHISNSKGLIYTTKIAVTIPGEYIVKGQKGYTAGSVAVGIVASAPGAQYNAALTDLVGDFSIVAYKGTSKYTKIYARLKTALEGGLIGQGFVIDPAAIASVQENLKNALSSKLAIQAQNLTPKGYILFDGAHQTSFAPIDPVSATSSASTTTAIGTADIGMKGIYSGYIMKIDSLLKTFAKDEVSQFPAGSYEARGVDNLDFAFGKGATTTLAKNGQLAFTLKGSLKIVGIVPADQLIKELVGVRISDSGPIIQRYSTISSAYATIFPVWMKSLPDSPDRITVQIQPE